MEDTDIITDALISYGAAIVLPNVSANNNTNAPKITWRKWKFSKIAKYNRIRL